MTIDKLIGLIGWPVSHSLSPSLQNAALAELGLDGYAYVPMPVSKYPYIRIKEAVLGLRALSCVGANITVPYKEAVVPYLDHLSDTAKEIGAVNTIAIDSTNRLMGFNTDGEGFIRDLDEKSIDPRKLRVLVLGAGGSARAVIHALLEQGCSDLSILNRTKSKTDDVANYFKAKFAKATIEAGPLDKEMLKQIRHADLIVNTTSVGMFDSLDQMPWDEEVLFSPDQIVYDVIYYPEKTKLLQHAERSGAKVFNGLGMLVQQGALSFKIWTGHDAPTDVMYAAAQKTLSLKSLP